MLKYNPNLSFYKPIHGAISIDDYFLVIVESNSNWVNLFIALDGFGYHRYSMVRDHKKGLFFYRLKLPEVGLYYYHFESEEGIFGAGYDLNAVKYNYSNHCDYQLTVTHKDFQTPDFLKGGLIYQIFPDRFCKAGNNPIDKGKILSQDWNAIPVYRNQDGLVLNNEFFGGDFKGILSKLYYLKSLGVTVIYLNPIVKAFSSHRYDTADYMKVDELLGSEEDLKTLLLAGKKMGISFIFDGVYNHTGADSVYFNKYSNYDSVGAYNSTRSPYYDWFDFYNFPDGYSSWWNFENLPSIKKDSKSYQDFITTVVLPHYFEMGFKGVRLDVVDELSDEFVEKIRQVAEKYGCAVIGEVWEDATNKVAYGSRRQYFLGKQLDSVMNYQLKDAICDFLLNKDVGYLVHIIQTQLNNYPRSALHGLMNVLSTHDTVRIINQLGREKIITDKDLLKDVVLSEREYNNGKKLAKLAYLLAYTLYGTPSLYYGDEAGLTGDLDPYNRRCYPWGKEDTELLEFFTKLGKLRQDPLFVDSDLNIILSDKNLLVYERTNGYERIIVAISLKSTQTKLHLSEPCFNMLSPDEKGNTFIINSCGFVVLKQIKD